MASPQMRCAIYTRKSTDRGLDMNVTSLEAQREVCSSYIKCQAHRNWVELPTAYDDGGFSGGSLERPALRSLMADIEDGRIDIIVIYKMDRLTRSLLDFVRLIEVFNRHQVSFVSVTQTFDTSDSMGRLILNILLTFAQFERELVSDRVRDKKAAMLRRGFYTGPLPPFGYLIDTGGRLCIDEERGALVREMFDRYAAGWTIPAIVKDLAARHFLTRVYTSKNRRRRGGQPITSAIVSHVLRNPTYTGHIVVHGDWIAAEIDPLVTRETWHQVQQQISDRSPKRDHDCDFLCDLLYDDLGRKMRIMREGPGRANSFRYYRSERPAWSRDARERSMFVRADEAECLVKATLSDFLRNPRSVKAAVMLDGKYSADIGKSLKSGALAAGRLERMMPPHFRSSLLSLSPRIEISNSELRVFISCKELKKFLAWDGEALFSATEGVPVDGTRVWIISCAASLIRGHARYQLPVTSSVRKDARPDERLASLISEATLFRERMHTDRSSTLAELATKLRVTQNYFVRVLRINYLAPDILTAVLDGTQPREISRKTLMDAAMILDWKYQRTILGFAPVRT